MPLTDAQERELREAGFIEHEMLLLKESLKETDVDLADMRWQHAMKDRAAWVEDKRVKGQTTEEMEQLLLGYYSTHPKLHPLHFLPQMQPPRKLSKRDKEVIG